MFRPPGGIAVRPEAVHRHHHRVEAVGQRLLGQERRVGPAGQERRAEGAQEAGEPVGLRVEGRLLEEPAGHREEPPPALAQRRVPGVQPQLQALVP